MDVMNVVASTVPHSQSVDFITTTLMFVRTQSLSLHAPFLSIKMLFSKFFFPKNLIFQSISCSFLYSLAGDATYT